MLNLWTNKPIAKLIFKEKVVNVKITRHYLLVICEQFAYLHKNANLKEVVKFETGLNPLGLGDICHNTELQQAPKIVLPAKKDNHILIISEDKMVEFNVGKTGIGHISINPQGFMIAVATKDCCTIKFIKLEKVEKESITEIKSASRGRSHV